MNIKWTTGAQHNLDQIKEYIGKENSKAAINIILKIITTAGLLSDNPTMGRIGRIFDTRELIISGTPFIVPYRIKSNHIEILRVFHSSMQWPKSLK